MAAPPYQESHLRSILKGLTWRVVATTTIIIIAKVTTGSTELALTIGGIEFFVKLALYYLHERAWQLVPRGTVRKAVGKDVGTDPLRPHQTSASE